MKKCLLIVCCLAFATGLNARLRFGFKAGGVVSSISQKIGDVTDSNTKPRFGFLIGGMAEYSFDNEFALQPELLYLLGGSERRAREPISVAGAVSSTVETTTKLHYILLPVNLKYRFGIESAKFYAAAGPYFGVAVGGNIKNTYTYEVFGVTVTSGNERDPFASDNRIFKRADFGMGVGLGVEIRKITLGVGYNFGLANIADTPNATSRTGTFSFSAGYFF
ncbi:MAG: PorT family protein [Prevotellaceae bacterium]|jgi:hypothetical protein|nr:PorT family protein [Prevotellaceae bacterium]